MIELERRALLGDKQAQNQCTEKGILLPCPFCEKEPIAEDNRVFCGYCGLAYEELDAGLSLRAWNTRPAPPIGRCRKCKRKTLRSGRIFCEVNGIMNEDDFCSYFESKER